MDFPQLLGGDEKIKRIKLSDELKVINAQVDDQIFKNFESLTVYLNNKYHIGINQDLPRLERYWILEHEVEHIKNHTLYTSSDDAYTINQKERITNDALVLKFGLPTKIYKMLESGMEKDEICKELNITENVYNYSCIYIIRNYLKLLGGKYEK